MRRCWEWLLVLLSLIWERTITMNNYSLTQLLCQRWAIEELMGRTEYAEELNFYRIVCDQIDKDIENISKKDVI